jgi:hypothetical protein
LLFYLKDERNLKIVNFVQITAQSCFSIPCRAQCFVNFFPGSTSYLGRIHASSSSFRPATPDVAKQFGLPPAAASAAVKTAAGHISRWRVQAAAGAAPDQGFPAAAAGATTGDNRVAAATDGFVRRWEMDQERWRRERRRQESGEQSQPPREKGCPAWSVSTV